jgi:hypothetical protein
MTPLRTLLVTLTGVGLLAALNSLAPPAADANLLANPGFEESAPGHAWMATGWDTSRTGLPTVFFGRDTLAPRSGNYSVNVANVSTWIPMSCNWSQGLVVGPEAWGRDAVFSVWTRNNGVDGRGYILLQAYRDTISKMAMIWKVERDEAMKRLKINRIDDPLYDLTWKRDYFSDTDTEWTRREVRAYVPPGTNVIFVRCGLLGTGQVMFDDASLTLEAPAPATVPAKTENLVSDGGFEGTGDDWEYSLPPYEGVIVAADSTVRRSGRYGLRIEGHTGFMAARTGVGQVLTNRALSGKKLRISAWGKSDSLLAGGQIKAFCNTSTGVHAFSSGPKIGGTMPWTKVELDVDVPAETWSIWMWFHFDTPAGGYMHWDDVSAVVVGEADPNNTGAVQRGAQ